MPTTAQVKSTVRRQLATMRTMGRPLTASERTSASITEVQKGGFLRIHGILYKVEGVNTYREIWKGETDWWYELKLVAVDSGDVIWLEWEDDDGIEVTLYGPKFHIDDLRLTTEMLEEFDDEEEGDFALDGKRFRYKDSGDCVLFEDYAHGEDIVESDAEEHYYWDFIADDGVSVVWVERWGNSYECGLGSKIDEYDIEIVTKGGE